MCIFYNLMVTFESTEQLNEAINLKPPFIAWECACAHRRFHLLPYNCQVCVFVTVYFRIRFGDSKIDYRIYISPLSFALFLFRLFRWRWKGKLPIIDKLAIKSMRKQRTEEEKKKRSTWIVACTTKYPVHRPKPLQFYSNRLWNDHSVCTLRSH